MDVHSLKNHIISKPEQIELILEESGFYNVTNNHRQNEYRAAREEGRNPTSVRVNKETLGAMCFSTNIKGDLLTLVQEKLNLSFPQTIKKISSMIGFKCEKSYQPTTLPFGGFYKNIAKLKSDGDIDLEVYSDDILDQFDKTPNLLFYKDGILPQVQIEYDVGYDTISRRISVPWPTFDGQVAGVMGRLNKSKLEEDDVKWFPIIPFPKSKTLYGYSKNYRSIKEKDIVMIGESEKHPMLLSSKGLNVGLSLGGTFMSDVQANHIKSLYPKTTLIMMDEGLEEDISRDIANQLKFNRFYNNRVGYIYDKSNLYMGKGSKVAPSDLDKGTLKKVIEHCTIWI